ncbi:MAG: lipoprotein insertase outer membrane protein LolB [Casimicrobiaceae bacterium]
MRVFRGWAVRAAGAGCVLALAACAGVAPSREDRSVDFAPVRSTFEASGRLSLRHGTDALTANFRWHHDGAADIVDLASPLGQTIARLTGDANGVSLRTADGRSISAADWRELGARSLEWSLPVDGLAFWIQGAPRPGAPFAVEAAADGGPGVLRQDGWTIVYQSFAPDPARVSRPARIALAYPGIEVKLVVDSWR